MSAALKIVDQEVLRDVDRFYVEDDSALQNRFEKRFILMDFRLWSLKVSAKSIPIHRLHNLSTKGMQIRCGKYQCYKVGEAVPVELKFMGATLFSTEAIVRWKKPSAEFVNMFQLGLEFRSDHQRRIDHMFLKRHLHRFLTSEERREELHPFIADPAKRVKQENERNYQAKLSDRLMLASVVIPFVAGYAFAFL